jgi:hypothetical protein
VFGFAAGRLDSNTTQSIEIVVGVFQLLKAAKKDGIL